MENNTKNVCMYGGYCIVSLNTTYMIFSLSLFLYTHNKINESNAVLFLQNYIKLVKNTRSDCFIFLCFPVKLCLIDK